MRRFFAPVLVCSGDCDKAVGNLSSSGGRVSRLIFVWICYKVDIKKLNKYMWPAVNNKYLGVFQILQETCAHKNPKKHRKSEQTQRGVQYFCVIRYCLPTVNRSGVNSALLCLSFIHYISSPFSPNSLLASATITNRVRHHWQITLPPRFSQACKRGIPRLPQPLTRPLLPLSLSADHHTYVDASFLAPAPLWYTWLQWL